jgi:hypothetical protein
VHRNTESFKQTDNAGDASHVDTDIWEATRPPRTSRPDNTTHYTVKIELNLKY